MSLLRFISRTALLMKNWINGKNWCAFRFPLNILWMNDSWCIPFASIIQGI